MRDVLIALAPSVIVSVYFFGFKAIELVLVGAVTCMGVEYLVQKYIMRVKPSVSDLSAAVTGVLLALNLPPNAPWWVMLIGSIVAIGVAKLTFGGLGHNVFNPALVGRVFLLISFPVQMTGFATPPQVDSLSGASMPAEVSADVATDAITGPTLLGYVKESLANGMTTADLADKFSYNDMLLGFKAGSLGEIAAMALLLGFLYMLCRKVITWHIPVAVLGSMFLFGGITWLIDPMHYMNPVFHLLTGGAILGAVFMATDYVTSPMSRKGMIVYGVGIGVITMLIRLWGSYPEGMSFAILIMNAVVPLINKYMKPKRFGVNPA